MLQFPLERQNSTQKHLELPRNPPADFHCRVGRAAHPLAASLSALCRSLFFEGARGRASFQLFEILVVTFSIFFFPPAFFFLGIAG